MRDRQSERRDGEEGIDEEREEEGGVSRKEWLERRHLSRKIGVGFQKPGDFAKVVGTEVEGGEAVAFHGHEYFKGRLDGVDGLFISLFRAPGCVYQRGGLMLVVLLWSFFLSMSISS